MIWENLTLGTANWSSIELEANGSVVERNSENGWNAFGTYPLGENGQTLTGNQRFECFIGDGLASIFHAGTYLTAGLTLASYDTYTCAPGVCDSLQATRGTKLCKV